MGGIKQLLMMDSAEPWCVEGAMAKDSFSFFAPLEKDVRPKCVLVTFKTNGRITRGVLLARRVEII